MPSLRRAAAVLALTVASTILPWSNLSAAPRFESRWETPQRHERVLRQSFSFWNVLVSLWERAGVYIDTNG
jgi:hypothetical protein